MRPKNLSIGLVVTLGYSLLLAACSGGGGGGSSPPNGFPFAPNAYFITSPDTPVTGTLHASAVPNSPISFQITLQPTHGSVSLGNSATGVFTYTPANGYTGADSFTFDAVNANGSSAPAVATILVNPKPPAVSAFGASLYIHQGGPMNAIVTVRLSNPPNGQATVNYATADGSAKAGIDYSVKSGTLTFGPGITSQTLSIPLSGIVGTTSRYFDVKLSGASSNLTPEQTTAIVVLRYYPEPLNDTGITGCTTATNFNPSNPDTCPQSAYPNQDADFGRDSAAHAKTLAKVGSGIFGYDFTKVGNDGKPLFNQHAGYTVDPWACVIDNWTGLEWEVPTPVVGAGLFDSSYLYTWYDPDPSINGGDAGTPNGGPNHLDSYHYVQRANQVGLCGYHDWRLPTAAELRNLINFGAPGVPNAAAGLPSVPTLEGGGYWSAIPVPNPLRALMISALYGYGSFIPKDSPGYVILVRGGHS